METLENLYNLYDEVEEKIKHCYTNEAHQLLCEVRNELKFIIKTESRKSPVDWQKYYSRFE